MTELTQAHFEVIDKNKAEVFHKENNKKLLEPREKYNRTKGLQDISEHELKKFNELMKYNL